LPTFSSGKLDQQKSSIVEAMKEAGELPEKLVLTEVEDSVEKKGSMPTPSEENHSLAHQRSRPPFIVVETRIPNILLDITDQPDIFHTVVVVQGDDPKKVEEILDSLRKSLRGERDEKKAET
jgi:hypothetical protein